MNLPGIYLTDNYPREGCQVCIDIQKRSCAVSVFAPQEYGHITPLEIYMCSGPINAGWVAGLVASGKKVPVNYQTKTPGD